MATTCCSSPTSACTSMPQLAEIEKAGSRGIDVFLV
jgi:hypothetical protein